jgi:lipopolysaccharide/colanic/teichoic acid biosynthesis glycosyltransferase
MSSYRGKRVLDLALTLPALIASLPVQVIVAALVRSHLGSPVLFRQERPGLEGRPFSMMKFRTMLPVDPERAQIDDACRVTRLGSFLRSTSLDELPTLWCIVKGDMSLVGPRPLLMQYLGRYSPTQARRHEVRPGLTGLAQVSGRNALTWDDKFRLDVEYIECQSLALDLRIIARTAMSVLRREGINADGAATMPEFLGGYPGQESRP